MSDKSLKGKAIKISGKDYVLVADRIIYFNEQYPDGSITTELVSPVESDIVIMKATVYPDKRTTQVGDFKNIGNRKFTGYSQAVKGAGFINKTAALENAETSAVGRALAMMGIGVIDSVASVDEIKKAEGTDSKIAQAKNDVYKALRNAGITDSSETIKTIEVALGKDTIDTIEDANKLIGYVKELDK